MATSKTTYKVVAPAGVYIRQTPQQSEDNVVRLADNGERLIVLEVGLDWVQTEEGYVMNRPYIIEPDATKPKKQKEEAE